jgi:hypothetical protein
MGDRRWEVEVGDGRWEMWQAWRVRFPASEVWCHFFLSFVCLLLFFSTHNTRCRRDGSHLGRTSQAMSGGMSALPLSV